MADWILRKWTSDDAADVVHYANNPKIAVNLRNVFPYPYRLEDAQCYANACAQDTEERQICCAIVVNGCAPYLRGSF